MSWEQILQNFRQIFLGFISWISIIADTLISNKIFLIGFYLLLIFSFLNLIKSIYGLFSSSKKEKIRNKGGGGEIT